MEQKFEKSNNKELKQQTISRRAFLGTFATLATASFSGCCAFYQKNSTTNASVQNEQASNQQAQQNSNFGQHKDQETINEVNREWGKKGKQWNEQKDHELKEIIEQERANSNQQPQQEVSVAQQVPNQQSPQQPRQEVSVAQQPVENDKPMKGKVWKIKKEKNNEGEIEPKNKRQKGRVWKGDKLEQNSTLY